MKYVDAERLREKITDRLDLFRELSSDTISPIRIDECKQIIDIIDSLQQEQPDDLASLISEATNVAKRIIDRDSFYNLLPQNIRNKYTFKAWCEILETLSAMKGQEQPEVDLDAEIEKELRLHYNDDQDVYWWNYLKNSFRHFYELGLNARKEENK